MATSLCVDMCVVGGEGITSFSNLICASLSACLSHDLEVSVYLSCEKQLEDLDNNLMKMKCA